MAVAIFDTTTGTRLGLLQLDPVVEPAVSAALASQASGAGVPSQLQGIAYQQVMWSPDGSSVAVTFFAAATTGGTTSATAAVGVLLADARAAHPRVLVHAPGSVDPAEWDMRDGVWLGAVPLPPALGYAWGADGALVPDTPLSTSAAPPVPPLGPVGAPDGGSAFTIWQPGAGSPFHIQRPGDASPSRIDQPGGVHLDLNTPSHQQIETPGVYTWATAFTAWSPDGCYLVSPVQVDGRLQPPERAAPSAQTLADFGLAQWPLLPVHDAALEELLLAMPTMTFSSTQLLAWRPDGRVLAVQPFAITTDVDPAIIFVTFYDTATGRLLGSLRPVAQNGSFEKN